MELRQGNKTLVGLIDEAGHALEEVVAWPASEIANQEADKAIKLLKKGWKEESYPRAFLYLVMLHIAHGVRSGVAFRDNITEAGLKKAWMKIGELL